MLNKIYSPIASEMAEMEVVLKNILSKSESESIQNITHYIFQNPGKRLRPALTLLTYFALSKNPAEKLDGAIQIAGSLELIHMASLVHDDIIDSAPLRHNHPTIHTKWGEPVGITMGVYLYSLSLQLIANVGNIDILQTVSSAVQNLCVGELTQVLERDNPSLSIERYLTILEQKTGVLFEAACASGGYLADASQEQINALRTFGSYLGLVFQIIDDYLDIIGDHKTLGKSAGQDIEMGEYTLPLLFLLEEAEPSKREHLIQLLEEKDPKNLVYLNEQIKSSSAAPKTAALAADYLEKAQDCLSCLPESPYKESLSELTQFVRARGFSQFVTRP